MEILSEILLTGMAQSLESEGLNPWNMTVGRKEANWRSENDCCIFGSGEDKLPLMSGLRALRRFSLVSDCNLLTATKSYSENRLGSRGCIPVALKPDTASTVLAT
jgi:hypothetical protein